MGTLAQNTEFLLEGMVKHAMVKSTSKTLGRTRDGLPHARESWDQSVNNRRISILIQHLEAKKDLAACRRGGFLARGAATPISGRISVRRR